MFFIFSNSLLLITVIRNASDSIVCCVDKLRRSIFSAAPDNCCRLSMSGQTNTQAMPIKRGIANLLSTVTVVVWSERKRYCRSVAAAAHIAITRPYGLHVKNGSDCVGSRQISLRTVSAIFANDANLHHKQRCLLGGGMLVRRCWGETVVAALKEVATVV